MKAKIISFIMLFVVSLPVFAQQKKVAVYVTGEQSGVKKILADKLVEGITYSKKYKAIERTANFLAELKKEQKYQRTGEVDDNDISRLGKQFGVQYVCAVDVIEELGQKYITARLINVESAEIVTTGNASSELTTMEQLLECANSIATDITGKTAQELADEEETRLLKKKQEDQEWLRWEQKLKQDLHIDYFVIDNYMITRPIGPCFKATITWEKALNVQANCNAGGYTDWRIPNAHELGYIYDELTKIWKKTEQFYLRFSYDSSIKDKIDEYRNKGYTDWIENQYGMSYNKSVKWRGDMPYELSLILIRKK